MDGVAERVGKTQEEKDKIKREGSLLGLVNTRVHQQLNSFFMISLVPTLLSLLGLIFFSYKYGRLVSPAVVLLLVSFLPSALLLVISKAKVQPGNSGPFPFLPPEVSQKLASDLSQPYFLVFLTSIGLLVLVIIIAILSRFLKKT